MMENNIYTNKSNLDINDLKEDYFNVKSELDNIVNHINDLKTKKFSLDINTFMDQFWTLTTKQLDLEQQLNKLSITIGLLTYEKNNLNFEP